MHVTILTIGSRGDVQPFIALGVGLQQAGHTVRLATHADFKPMIQARGLEFAPVRGAPQEVNQGEAGQALLKSGRNPFTIVRHLPEFLETFLEQVLADSWQACQGTDAILATYACFWGFDIAQQQGIPFYSANLQTLTPTKAVPFWFTPQGVRLGGLYNQFTYLLTLLTWPFFRPSVNQWRQSMLHLPPISIWQQPIRCMEQQEVPFLYGYSPSVLPRDPAWSAQIHVTGYWFLDSLPDFSPPQDLVDFLAAGSPPVSIGFGGIEELHNPEMIIDIALKALAKTGQRGILLTRWSGISNTDLPDQVLKLESFPYDWLFPFMGCVVHHGGAGTTAAGLRAGVPTIVIPFITDQPFWGYRLKQLGVGQLILRQELTVERLATAISTAIEDQVMGLRAKMLGEKIRSENGVGQAVQVFHQYLPRTSTNRLTKFLV